MSDDRQNYSSFEEMFAEIHWPWYRRWLPFFPCWNWNKNLRVFYFILWDCSYCAHPITKKHLIDILYANHPKWWQPNICGFQLWL